MAWKSLYASQVELWQAWGTVAKQYLQKRWVLRQLNSLGGRNPFPCPATFKKAPVPFKLGVLYHFTCRCLALGTSARK
jgi:hypothetical protein